MTFRSLFNKQSFKLLAYAMGLLVLALFVIDRYVSFTTSTYIYDNLNNIPKKKAALVLGTTKYVATGTQNLYYRYRLDAVEKLFKAGKVDAIVISGDNATRYYNEPVQMQKDLIKRGISQDHITLDYAGFRTLDSVVRAKAIFDLDSYTVVSQRFHCERAIFLAHAHNQPDVIAYQAQSVPLGQFFTIRLREVLARFKAFLDIYILGTKPKFLGDKVSVNYRNNANPQSAIQTLKKPDPAPK